MRTDVGGVPVKPCPKCGQDFTSICAQCRRPILKQSHDTRIFWSITALVALLWLVFAAIILFALPSSTLQIKGTFGDSFGALNTLFSGLAFAGLIAALITQQKELHLQRHEMEMSRVEMTRSGNAQAESALALRRQLELNEIAARITATSLTITSLDHEISTMTLERATQQHAEQRQRLTVKIEDAQERRQQLLTTATDLLQRISCSPDPNSPQHTRAHI